MVFEKSPAAQGVQDREPGDGCEEPAGHLAHVSKEVEPGRTEKVPAGHARQVPPGLM